MRMTSSMRMTAATMAPMTIVLLDKNALFFTEGGGGRTVDTVVGAEMGVGD